MKHPKLRDDIPSERAPAYEAGPNGFLARAVAAGFGKDINALVNKYVREKGSRARLRLEIDQHGLSGGNFAKVITSLQSTGKLALGFYGACLILNERITETFKAG